MGFKQLLRKAKRKAKMIIQTFDSSVNKAKSAENTIFCWKVNDWKQEFLQKCFKDHTLVFFEFKMTEAGFIKRYKDLILSGKGNRLLIWGLDCPEYLTDFAKNHSIPCEFAEDGFIRSIGLGSKHVLPMSLVFDKKGLYFDATRPSELEHLLNTYDFKADNALMDRALKLKEKLLSAEISKYNNTVNIDTSSVYGDKKKKRILVIGQVEDDASVRYGCKRGLLQITM